MSMTTETKQPPVHDDPLAIKRCHSTLTQPHAVTTATGSACMQSNEKDTNHLLLHDVFHHDHEMLLIPISYGYHRRRRPPPSVVSRIEMSIESYDIGIITEASADLSGRVRY